MKVSGGELKVLLHVEECLSSKPFSLPGGNPSHLRLSEKLPSELGIQIVRKAKYWISTMIWSQWMKRSHHGPHRYSYRRRRGRIAAPKGESSGESPSYWWTSTSGIRSADGEKSNLLFFHGFTKMEIVRDVGESLHSTLLSRCM